MKLRKWFKRQSILEAAPGPSPTLTPNTFWRMVVSLKQPVLLLGREPFRVLKASEPALELLGVRSEREAGVVLRDVLDDHLRSRLEMALAGEAMLEQRPVRLRSPNLDLSVKLTVATVPDYPGEAAALLFLSVEPAVVAPVWPGLARELMSRVPHPIWVTDNKGVVTYANAAVQDFPVPMTADKPLEAETPELLTKLREARDLLFNQAGKVRASPMLADVTLSLGPLGIWRVLHFAFNPTDPQGLVCAIAIQPGAQNGARGGVDDTPLHELLKVMEPEILARVMQVREAERRALGREIHDSLGQELTVLRLELRRLVALITGSGLANETMLEHFRSVRAQVDKLSLSARHIAYELRQEYVKSEGLTVSIENLVHDMRNRVGIPAQLEMAPGWVEPEAGMAHHIHRSLQEMLNNVSKHSKATRCLVRLGLQERTYWAEVRDDGVGIEGEKTEASVGMSSLRERAEIYGGNVTIQSRPELEGTLVRIELVERRWPPPGRQ